METVTRNLCYLLLPMILFLGSCVHFSEPGTETTSHPHSTPTRLIFVWREGGEASAQEGIPATLSLIPEKNAFPVAISGLNPKKLGLTGSLTYDATHRTKPLRLMEEITNLHAASFMKDLNGKGYIFSDSKNSYLKMWLQPKEYFVGSEGDLKTHLKEALNDRDWKWIIFKIAGSGNLLDEIKKEAAPQLNDSLLVIVNAPESAPEQILFPGKNTPFKGPPALSKIARDSMTQAIVLGPQIQIWNSTRDPVRLSRMTDDLRDLPKLSAIFLKKQTGLSYHYVLTYGGKKDPSVQDAYADILEGIVDEHSPEIVIICEPLIRSARVELAAPNLNLPPKSELRIHITDLAPIMARILDVSPSLPYDGDGAVIDPYVLRDEHVLGQ